MTASSQKISDSPGIDLAPLRMEAEGVLRQLAGPDASLRDDQWTAIEALVSHSRRVLVVQRTGWGKSAVYFVATALLRARDAGATVIVSPLLSLMRNQVAAAARAGIRARTLNSSNLEDWDSIRAEVAAGAVDVLLISPERLNNPDFRETVLPHLAATTGLLVVDEAHCVSDWGHDFRPDYRRIATLLAELPRSVPVLATTATANARVVADVAEQLAGDNVDTAVSTLVLRGSLDRESLALGVVSLPSAAHRLAWLTSHLGDLPGSGILYTLTVAQAEEVTAHLRAAGHHVVAYTGRTDNAEREAAEDDLLANRVKALVATSALGMGFDKPDLGFVVHLGAPQSPIAYYQQVGRAGRAVDSAQVVLLPGVEDEAIWRYFGGLAFPPESSVREVLAALTEAAGPRSTAALETSVDLSRSRLEMLLKVLDVDSAVRRVRGGWVSTGLPWSYDAERYARLAEARATEQQAMRDYLATTECRMDFLRRQLDDPTAGSRCGRCDNCAGAFVPTDVTSPDLAQATAALHRPGEELEPRRMWPTGLAALDIPLSGRIAPAEQCGTGRAVARLSDLGWGPRLRALLDEAAPDQPIPDDVLAAVVAVLHDWTWETRPVAVAWLPSPTHPQLVESLAARIAELGRLTPLGSLTGEDAIRRAESRVNSAQQVAALYDRLTVPAAVRSALTGISGPVLLIAGVDSSGWALTLGGRELRRAGVPAVLPLALAAAG